MTFTPARLARGAVPALVLVVVATMACGSPAPVGEPAGTDPAPEASAVVAPSPSDRVGTPATDPTTPTDVAAPDASGGGTATSTGAGPLTLGPADRPAELVAPSPANGPAPLLVLLHGYGSNTEEVDRYFGATAQAQPRGLYVLIPGGRTDQSSRQFWDATAACCNFTGTPVDDVGYLGDLIDQAVREHPIDPGRVYVMGHSNGGFMTYRLACELADRVTAVAVVSGADAPRTEDCAPAGPVSVLHVHGDADALVSYAGGQFLAPFPGAVESTARWAARNGCDPAPVAGDPVDLDAILAGAETEVVTYPGCPDGIDVQLDTIRGGGHIPAFAPDQVGLNVLDWLLAHTR